MKVDIIAKTVVVKALLLYSLSTFAWTVSDRIVELSQEGQPSTRRMDLIVTEKEPIEDQELAAPKMISDRQESREFKKMGSETANKRSAIISNKESNSEVAVFEKTQASYSLEERMVLEHRRALKYMDKGEHLKAQAILIEVLDQLPRFHDSRIELATFYIKHQRLESAEALLQEGLKLDENHPDFLRLMAMVHDRKGDSDKALAFLVKVKDSRKQDKNYIALLGHVYHQTGRYSLARQQYFRLLEMEPKNSLWLLGVSLALDAEGQREVALEGYQRLTAEGNIDPSILEYVQNRINILKG